MTRSITNTSPSQTNHDIFRNGWADYLHSIKQFSRNARLYLFGSFLMGLNFQVFQLLLNLYLKELGFAEGDIGLVNSSRALGMTLMAIPAGILISRIRLKPLLIVSTITFALFSFGLANSGELLLLAGFALLAGLSFSFYRVAAGPFFMRNSSPIERTHLFSFHFAMNMLAGMVGSLGAGHLVIWLGQWSGDIVLGYRYTLFIGIAIGLAAVIPYALIYAKRPSPEERRIRFSMARLRERGMFYLKISSANFLIGMGAGLIIPFLNLYFRDRFNMPPDDIALYYFFVQCSMVAGTLAGPALTRKFGLVRTIVLTQALSIPFMLTLSYSFVLPIAVMAFVLRGGLMNSAVPLGTNFAMELADKEEQGLVNALLAVSWTGSWMVAAAVGGKMIESYGYTLTLNVATGLYVMSILLYYWFFHHVERRHEESGRWFVPQVTENE